MSYKLTSLFFKLILIIICIKFGKQTTFYDPATPVPPLTDRVIDYTVDANAGLTKYVWFNYVMSSSNTNYYDYRNGEIYEGKQVILK